jgi:1-deoxy-D-xylulose-5-phosphate reductoisomerase
LALEAAKVGGTSPAVLSASNEVATSLFLEGKIPFTRIPQLIEAVLRNHTTISNPGIEEILEADAWAREEVKSLI